jgi:hypothetical protein
MQFDSPREEQIHAFMYGIEVDELSELTDPFYLVAAIEEELGQPLAQVN